MVRSLVLAPFLVLGASAAAAGDGMVVDRACFAPAWDEDDAVLHRPSARPRRVPPPSSAPSGWVGGMDEAAEEAPPRMEQAARAAQEAKAEAQRKTASRPASQAATPLADAENTEWSQPWTGQPSTPSFDWGGQTWLSNDDSMSLASAQRVLWLAQQGRAVPTSQVRPHELLNYFTFDTEQPTGSATFEVTASAEAHGDTLSLALAVQGATPARQPLDLTLVIDRSGSMREDGRMDYVRRGLRTMTEQLTRGDRVDVVLFDDTPCTAVENYTVGRDDPAALMDVLARMQPEGGTNLDAGLQEAYDVARRKTGTHRRNRRVMLLTDAMLNQGRVDPSTVASIGARYEDEGIRLTGVGVGRDFNDQVLDKLTEKGKGAYVYLGSEAVVDRVFGSGFDALVQTIAHDVRFRLDLPDSLALEKFYGEEASTEKADIQPIHYYAGTSQVFLQDLKVRPSGLVLRDPVGIEVSWRDAQTGEPETRRFTATVGDMLEADPHNVRKARALMAFSDLLLARTMRSGCEEARATFDERRARVSDDAEIAYVAGLAEKQCATGRSAWSTPSVSTGLVDLKVKVDSDIPVSGIAASCPSGRVHESLSAADTVARFRVSPGTCKLTLDGVVPMTTTVTVGAADTDVRCTVRGGRLACAD
jgi:Ca-activated chloride channel family protein